MQTHFRTHMFKGLHQEVGRSHPEFERTKDMFDGAPSLLHLPWMPVQAVLHRIKDAFMLPSLDPPFLAGGALGFQRTLRLELAAIDRHDGLAEQVELATQGHEPLAHIADAFPVIVAEVGDGLEVRR